MHLQWVHSPVHIHSLVVGMVKEVSQESPGVCIRAASELFSSLKTACSPSTAYHQGEHPHQIFRICGYMVNSVFNFLIDTGPCWPPFSLLRPTQKEVRVCFHSQFKGAARHGSGAEHGSRKKRR